MAAVKCRLSSPEVVVVTFVIWRRSAAGEPFHGPLEIANCTPSLVSSTLPLAVAPLDVRSLVRRPLSRPQPAIGVIVTLSVTRSTSPARIGSSQLTCRSTHGTTTTHSAHTASAAIANGNVRRSRPEEPVLDRNPAAAPP